MDDYLNVLDPPFRWTIAVGRITDNGGVHLNSAIWNNALWIDPHPAGQDRQQAGATSPRWPVTST